jgi:hypothetical protein
MGVVTGFFSGLFLLCYIGFFFWITWMFYRALARIGEELSGIRRILERGLPQSPNWNYPPATRRPDEPAQ